MTRSKYCFLLFFLLLSPSTTIAGLELDIKEANVTGVTFEQIDLMTFRFNVTLYHDDDGEEGYANFWVVETLNRTELGRRILTHAHGSQEFSRSGSIIIPEDIEIVVVRGHDQTHGFGGQAILVNLRKGELEVINQGSDPIDFSDRTSIIPNTSQSIPTIDSKSSPGIEIVTLILSILVLEANTFRKRKKSGEKTYNGS